MSQAQNCSRLSRILEEWQAVFQTHPRPLPCRRYAVVVAPEHDYLVVYWDFQTHSIKLQSYASLRSLKKHLLDDAQADRFAAWNNWVPVMGYRLSSEQEFCISPRGFHIDEYPPGYPFLDGFRATRDTHQLECQTPQRTA